MAIMRCSRHVLGILVLAAATLAASCGGPSSDRTAPATEGLVLKFSAIPDQNTTELQEKFKPFSEHLSRTLGVTVEYVPARDYQATVEMFVNGDIGLAWFGGLTGVQARLLTPGSKAIAQGAEDESEMGVFHDIYGPQRLRNLRFRLDEYLRFGLEAGVIYVN